MADIAVPRENHGMKKLADLLIEPRSRRDQVAPRITAIREHLAMSKADFADSIALDRSSLTKIENGDAGLDIAKAEVIAELYGYGLDFIYRGDLDDVPLPARPAILNLLHAHRAKL